MEENAPRLAQRKYFEDEEFYKKTTGVNVFSISVVERNKILGTLVSPMLNMKYSASHRFEDD